MNSVEFDQVTAFLATVDHEGFTTAGQVIGRDGSILSRRVTALEKRLGVRLLERTTRRLALTEAGELFHRRMSLIMQTMSEIERDTADAAATVHGTLRVALPSTFGRMWIAPLMPEFLKAFPGIRVETAYEDRYVDLIAESFDVAVRIGSLADSRLIARKIASDRRVLCASQDYLAAHGVPRSPSDLAHHACLSFGRLASHPTWHLRSGQKSVTVRVSGPLTTDDAYSLVQAAVAGTGIVMVSDWLAGPELSDGRLIAVLPNWSIDAADAVHIVHASARLVPAKTRAFVDWLAGRMAPAPWISAERAGHLD